MANNGNGTTDLDPRLLATTTYLEREYQRESLRREIYLAPVDEREIERLEKQHQLCNLIFEDKPYPLFLAPVDEPEQVLDCGHGAASWAYEVATGIPECQVIGVDISTQMNPDDIPDNLELQVADLNDRFTFQADFFDLVNSRFVSGGISFARWPNYVADIRRVLKRGGWAQLIEWNLMFRSANGEDDELQSLQKWYDLYCESLGRTSVPAGKKDRAVHQKLEILMRGAGFVDVQVDVREIPTSPWPTDYRGRRMGEMNGENMAELIRSQALFPVTTRGILNPAEFEALCEQAAHELQNLRSKPYLSLYVCCGRKP